MRAIIDKFGVVSKVLGKLQIDLHHIDKLAKYVYLSGSSKHVDVDMRVITTVEEIDDSDYPPLTSVKEDKVVLHHFDCTCVDCQAYWLNTNRQLN